MIVQHYFSGAESLYNDEIFEQRFGLPRSVINRVFQALIGNEPFIFKHNMAGERLGIWPLVCIVSSLRMLVYGDATDRLDESLQMSKSPCKKSLRAFSRLVFPEIFEQIPNC